MCGEEWIGMILSSPCGGTVCCPVQNISASLQPVQKNSFHMSSFKIEKRFQSSYNPSSENLGPSENHIPRRQTRFPLENGMSVDVKAASLQVGEVLREQVTRRAIGSIREGLANRETHGEWDDTDLDIPGLFDAWDKPDPGRPRDPCGMG